MPVEIKIFGESAGQTLNELRDFTSGMLGFHADPVKHTVAFGKGVSQERAVAMADAAEIQARTGQTVAGLSTSEQQFVSETVDIIAEQQADVEQAKAATQRERGKPGEGRARRTKVEIAEDEAADAADAASVQAGENSDASLGISTGGERINPDEEQDAADETAEKAANTKPGADLTTEDLRAAVATYQKKHGMAAAVALVKEGGLIGCTIDAVPQERLAAMIEALGTSAVSVSPTVSTDKTDKPSRPEYPATKEGLMKAMLDYALKFDGTNDVSKANNTTMPATMEDCPKIFVMRFGEAINSLGKVPADGYAQAITDVQDATEKNPFKRAVKGGA